MSTSTSISPDSSDSRTVFWLRFLTFPVLAIVLYPLFVMGYGGEHVVVRCGWVAGLTYCWGREKGTLYLFGKVECPLL